MINKADILTALNSRLGDRGEADIDELIERVLLDMTRNVPALRKEYTLVITVGVSEYDLAVLEPDIRAITEIRIDGGVPIDKITYAEYLERKAGQTTSGRYKPEAYCYYNDTLFLSPDPDTTYTGTIGYSSYELDADSIGLSNIWKEAVICGCCKQYLEDIGNMGETNWQFYNGAYDKEIASNMGLQSKKESQGQMKYNG